ncbi:MAG: Flp pilus assembly protein CpaB [Phycisphaerales bacterium]|nr:MAG: Flp pilus assembly protein CpaB [Phycisphaerales bacterium]
MSGKALIPLVLGLGIGLLAIRFGMDTLRNAKGQPVETDKRQVVRALTDVDASLAITPQMLEVVETADPPLGEMERDFASAEDVVDRVAGKFIPKGAVVLESMLAPPGTAPGVPGKIEAGYRAVSLRIDEVTGVAFNVTAGAWVDVIVVMDVMDPNTHKRETLAEVVLEHIQVAAVGLSSAGEGNNRSKIARSVTLLVAEEEVPKLHLAATKGKITLAMRGEHDVTTGKRISARESELFTGLEQPKEDEETVPPPDFSRLAGMFKEDVEAAAVPDPPFTMTIARGAPAPVRGVAIQQFTFENAQSWKVLAVAEGLPSQQKMVLQAQARQAPNVAPDLQGPAQGPSGVPAPPSAQDEEEEGSRSEPAASDVPMENPD